MKNKHLLLILCVLAAQCLYAQTTPNFTMRPVKCAMEMPWEITYGPDNFIWATESRGYKVSRINPTTGVSSVLLDLTNNKNFPNYPSVSPQGGLMGMALHPNLLTGKPYVYLAYVYRYDGGAAPTGQFFKAKVVRYTYNATAQTLTNEEVLCDTIPASNDHNGGRMTISNINNTPYLFYGVGDMGGGQFDNANRPNKAQDPTSYEGKILRFNIEPDADPNAFDKWIPNDGLNTFGRAVYSIGHRNPQGLVAGLNGNLYQAEHGPYSDDELNLINGSGRNYGHPLVVGMADGNYNGAAVGAGTGVPPIVNEVNNATALGAAYRNPLKSFFPVANATIRENYLNAVNNTPPVPNYFLSWNSIAPSGIDYYKSTAIPNFQNSILITSLKRRRVYRLQLDAAGTAIVSDTIPLFPDMGRYRDVCISADGTKIYVSCDSEGQTSGPTAGTTIDPPNKGCILEFTYTPIVNNCAFTNCPQSQTYTLTSGTTQVVTWVAPTLSNCAATATISSNYVSGATFPVGTTTVTYTATNGGNTVATCSFNIVINPVQSGVYCASKSAAPWNEWISNVLLNTINNTSEKIRTDRYVVGYSDWTDKTTTLNRGQTYPLSITPSLGFIGNLPQEFCRVWIDFNANSIFEDGEIVLEKNNLNPFVSNIVIPTTALLGTTRMRVSLKNGGYPTACEAFPNGEVEDYTVTIGNGTVVTNSCRLQDSLQLVSFYNATNGPLWVTKWNLNSPINTWYGVTLNANGCVTRLSLGYNQIFGTIPNPDLPNLTELSLGSNGLTGTLPNFNLPNLTILDISANRLAGTLPNLNFPKLTHLNLDNNQFTGTIPNFNCPNLTVLSLRGNKLTGTIPNFNLPNLTEIYLDINQLSGTIPNFNLPQLKILWLGSNLLSGTIPNFNLPNLTFLTLHYNQLSGEIPSFNFPNITNLYLYANQLSGCIPESFKAFCGKQIDFTNNPNLTNQNFTTFCSANIGVCTTTTNQNYCTSKGTLPWEYWVSNVQLNTINNTSTQFKTNTSLGYSDYTNLSTTLNRGQTYPLSISAGLSWVGNLPNTYCRVWIDFNQNKTFEANELVLEKTNQNPFNQSILIPTTAILGVTRMRVSVKNGAYPTACETFAKGEVEDYTVTISSSAACNAQLKCPPDTTVTIGSTLTGYCSVLPNTPTIDLTNCPFSTSGLSSNQNGCLPVGTTPITWTMNFTSGGFSQCLYKVTVTKGMTTDADLALSMTSTPSVYRQFTPHNFRITCVNSGISDFTNVKIKFNRPALTSGGGTKTASIGTYRDFCSSGVECSEWTIPTLAAGATATLDAPVFVLAATGVMTATATLLSSTPIDNTTTNNTTSIAVNPSVALLTSPQALTKQQPTQLIPIVIERISPNPTAGDVIIQLNAWSKQVINVTFADITGKTIYSEKREVEKGLNKVAFDLYHLPQGVYFIQTDVGKGRDVPTKFIKM